VPKGQAFRSYSEAQRKKGFQDCEGRKKGLDFDFSGNGRQWMELRKRGRLGRPLDRDSFLKAIAQFPPSIFHAKGIFEFSDDPQPMLFQYVAGRRELSVFPRSTITDRFLTLTGKGDDPGHAAFSLQSLLYLFSIMKW
jgi:hypothetical protein